MPLFSFSYRMISALAGSSTAGAAITTDTTANQIKSYKTKQKNCFGVNKKWATLHRRAQITDSHSVHIQHYQFHSELFNAHTNLTNSRFFYTLNRMWTEFAAL